MNLICNDLYIKEIKILKNKYYHVNNIKNIKILIKKIKKLLLNIKVN